MVIIVSVFAACSAGADETAVENTSSESTSVSTTAENTTNQTTENENISSDESVSGSAETNESNFSGNSNSGSGSSNTTTKKSNTTTTKKSSTTTKKQTTTKKETTTKKKETTTKKVTTTQKHVSPYDVQKQVNDYIRSKGWHIATDLTPSNASWRTQISGSQESLDEGYSLRMCKDFVDMAINEGANKQWGMCCYYSSSEHCFYILYSY